MNQATSDITLKPLDYFPFKIRIFVHTQVKNTYQYFINICSVSLGTHYIVIINWLAYFNSSWLLALRNTAGVNLVAKL